MAVKTYLLYILLSFTIKFGMHAETNLQSGEGLASSPQVNEGNDSHLAMLRDIMENTPLSLGCL